MKHLTSVLACACGLAFAAPVLAQDSAMIVQSGTGNNAMIEQIGNAGSNHAAVHQGEGWYGGSGNSVQLTQYSVDNSRIDVMQSGSNNQYAVYQHNGSNLQASINLNSGMYNDMGGENNTVHIYQSGWNAQASVEQGGSSYSRAEISQHGADYHNLADIRQSGSGNQGTIYQYGGANQATIQQSGYNQHASITQQSGNYGYGNGNTASIRQGY